MRLTTLLLLLCTLPVGAQDRVTPLVRAVQLARSSVVNLHSEKSSRSTDDRKVSGMGTGIVIDERGYVVTNHHVVHEVDSLEASLVDGSRYRARVIAFDKGKDLAIIKINPRTRLKVMPLGTSSDIMLAESVFAVGNAYGYDNSVTAGIVSALGRDVEVNETQSYYNLIQTDASINPGNSGGPLLNIKGDVIGINVAIRAGAQRIGFAIPIDDARKTIARMMSAERLFGVTAGLVTRDVKRADVRQVIVDRSTASGISSGDQIVRVGSVDVEDSVDVSRALFDRRPGDVVKVQVRRDGRLVETEVQLTKSAQRYASTASSRTTRTVSLPASKASGTSTASRAWRILGFRLAPLTRTEIAQIAPGYRGGMRITQVRSGSPAAAKGIRPGDFLVGLHIWETLNDKDMAYILGEEQVSQHNPMTFYLVRQGKTMFGQLAL